MTEPVLILEILSPSNQQDTRDNVWMFMTIPSVRQILLLAPTAVRGEMFERRADGTWPEEARDLSAADIVYIESIDFSCALSCHCDRTNLAPP